MPGKRPRSERSGRNRLGLRASGHPTDERPPGPVDPSLKVLRPCDVFVKVGLSPMSVWRLEEDDQFPKKFPLGSNSVGYLAHEIDEWIRRRAAARKKPSGKPSPKRPRKPRRPRKPKRAPEAPEKPVLP